jgi:hypothetical protein
MVIESLSRRLALNGKFREAYSIEFNLGSYYGSVLPGAVHQKQILTPPNRLLLDTVNSNFVGLTDKCPKTASTRRMFPPPISAPAKLAVA